MSDYKELRKVIKNKCIFKEREAIEDFKDVNEKIKEITNNDVEKIKSLICGFEGKLNKAVFYSLAAIGYALEIGAISVLCGISSASDDQKVDIALTMFVIAIGLIIAGVIYSINDKKDTFILKALYFKLDELNNKDESSKETGVTNEPDIKNGANTANEQDGKMNCKKYVVRVYDK